jgi:NitT/TauT family transport system substrate-binding protein
LGGLAAGIAAIALVAACGSGTPSATPLTSVKLQIEWVPQAQFAGFYVALDKGFYRDEGLDVEILPGGPEVRSIDQVQNGAAQFGLESPLGMFQARDAGVPIKLIAQFDQKDGFVKITRKTSGITEPAQFRGKTVGVWPDEWEFYPLMASVDIDPQADLTLVQQAFTMDDFINGNLDVASATLWNEYNVVLESGISADELTVFNYSDYGFGVPHGALLATEDYVANNRETAVKFVRASIKGWLDAYADQKGAIDIVMKVVEGGTEQSAREHQELMLAAMETLQLPDGFAKENFAKPDPAYYDTAVEIINGYLEPKTDLVAADGFDPSIWADAAK